MDTSRLSEYSNLIKQQFVSQERLLEFHSKMEGLIELILSRDLFHYPSQTLRLSLSILGDLVRNAKALNEETIDSLDEMSALLIDLKAPPHGGR